MGAAILNSICIFIAAMAIALLFKILFSKPKRKITEFQKGVEWAEAQHKKFGHKTANRMLERKLQAAKAFFTFNDFDRGVEHYQSKVGRSR